MAQILWQNKFATKIKMDKGDINVELLLVQTNFHLLMLVSHRIPQVLDGTVVKLLFLSMMHKFISLS